jgi:hypothetical protein
VPATQAQDQIAPSNDDAPIPFDRRLELRAPAYGDYVGVVIDGDAASLTNVELVDKSVSGLGFLSPVEMRPGAICHLHPHGVIALAEVGRVARCTPDGEIYHVGLVSLRRCAA